MLATDVAKLDPLRPDANENVLTAVEPLTVLDPGPPATLGRGRKDIDLPAVETLTSAPTGLNSLSC